MARQKSSIPVSSLNIMKAMEEKHLNKTTLAESAGISANTVHRVLNTEKASFETIGLMAKALDVSVFYLIGTAEETGSYDLGVEEIKTTVIPPTEEKLRFMKATRALNEFMNNTNLVNPADPTDIRRCTENLMVADIEFYDYMRLCAWKWLEEHGYIK